MQLPRFRRLAMKWARPPKASHLSTLAILSEIGAPPSVGYGVVRTLGRGGNNYVIKSHAP